MPGNGRIGDFKPSNFFLTGTHFFNELFQIIHMELSLNVQSAGTIPYLCCPKSEA
jgi:hypothetical protein